MTTATPSRCRGLSTRLALELSLLTILTAALEPYAARGNSSDTPKTGNEAPGSGPSRNVTRGRLERTIEVDAMVEPTEMRPISVAARTWSELSVVEAVPHGAKVKKGDVLVRFDTRKIRDQIADLELESPLAAAALELTEIEYDNLVVTTPDKLDAARRERRVANEDLAYFEATDRDSRQKNAEMNVRRS